MKSIYFILFYFLSSQLMANEEFSINVFFDTDIDTLSATEIEKLKGFIKQTNKTVNYKEVYVVGNTDADGSTNYNLNLSKRRAEFVKSLLVKNGLKESLIDQNYKGETAPLVPNINEINKQQNRRVEITLKAFQFSNPVQLINELVGNPTQFHPLDNTKDGIIEGKAGMLFHFPPFCFISDKKIEIDYSKIEIELIEVRNPIQSLFSNTLAQSPEGILESGGMFKLNAYYKGEQLNMKSNMQYTVQIENSSNIANDMKVYLPIITPESPIIWQASNTPFVTEKVNKSINPSLFLDSKLMKDWLIKQTYDSILKNFTFNLPVKPKTVKYPYKPSKPKEPKITDSRFNLKNFNKPFRSKTKKLALQKELFDKLYANYEQSLLKYQNKLLKFETDSANFPLLRANYKIDSVQYQIDYLKLKNELNTYKKSIDEYLIVKTFPMVRNALQKQIDAGNYRKSSYFYDLTYHIRKNLKKDAYSIFHSCNYNKYISLLPDFKKTEEYFIEREKKDSFLFQETMSEVLKQNRNIYNYINNQISAIDPASVSYVNASYTNYYRANLNRFDWINCDRFYNVPQDRMVNVKIPKTEIKDINYYVVYKDINSLIKINPRDGQIETKIIKDKEVTIVAIGFDEENNPLFAKNTFLSNDNQTLNLKFETLKMSELKEAINSI